MSLPQRKSQRLQGYDYSKGAYFITICINENQLPLSEISYESTPRRDSPCGCPKLRFTLLGEICEEALKTVQERCNVIISDYIIMPDHIHIILFMNESEPRTAARAVPTVSSVVGAYKSLVSTQWLKVCKARNLNMGTLWERSFYDHIIRDDEDYYVKARYMEENPIRWCLKHNLI